MAKYKKVRALSEGGQGKVWLARSAEGHEVAVKILKLTTDEQENAALRRRFKREVTYQSSLEHPGIMPVVAAKLDIDEPYFIMELAEGTLRDRLPLHARPPVPMPDGEVWDVFDQILEAVEFAHENGVIHRDLKPENVLFYNGRAALSDFGMVKNFHTESTLLTMSGMVLGTLGYIAPEQLSRSKDADERCDIYALGRMLHEMLTGEYSAVAIDVMRVPPKFRHIVSKATKTDPEQRFQSVAELRREFALLGEENEDTESPVQRATKLVKAVAGGKHNRIEELVRVFLENDDDLAFFTAVVPLVPEAVLSQIAMRDADQYLALMQIFDKFADGQFAWDFTDTIAIFLVAAYKSTNDVRVHEVIIRRLLVLGSSHNRWFVRSKFIDVVRIALAEAHYAPIVARALRENDWAIEFVRSALEELSLPAVIRTELLAA